MSDKKKSSTIEEVAIKLRETPKATLGDILLGGVLGFGLFALIRVIGIDILKTVLQVLIVMNRSENSANYYITLAVFIIAGAVWAVIFNRNDRPKKPGSFGWKDLTSPFSRNQAVTHSVILTS